MTLIKNIQEYIRSLYQEHKDSTAKHLYYHNYTHTLGVVKVVDDLNKHSDLTKEEKEASLIAAWFHDIGYLFDYQIHEDKGIELLKGYASTKSIIPDKLLALAISGIDGTRMGRKATTEIEQILADADMAYGFVNNFNETGNALRKEWKYQLNKEYTDQEWDQLQYNFLNHIHFYTAYAQEHFKPKVKAYLEIYKEKLR
ncbi:MAG: HD domain-containing protein [Saprospiraceae bacterium]|nr:HD domain-containing protein [Saprospiraceae bacterium]